MNKVPWQLPRHIHYEKQLRTVAANWFAVKGYPVSQKYKYILANREDWHKNIILPEVANYIIRQKAESESNKKAYPLHKYLHHGLSSQAMLFNLVGPLIVRNDLESLRIALEPKGIHWPEGHVHAAFEFEDRTIFNESQGQPTSIDLVVWSDNKPSIFIEGKLVEKEFGGCSVFAKGDCDGRNPAQDFDLCFLHHIGRRYWDLMRVHGLLDGPIAQDSVCIITSYYQFFREVLTALKLEGTFVLICDRRSPTFAYQDGGAKRGLMPFLLSLIPPAVRARIKVVYIQDLVTTIRESGRHEWIGEFKKKYGIS